jgi:DHA1 family bicyclomycin/chloramphenicol resistance-like MFS transporter
MDATPITLDIAHRPKIGTGLMLLLGFLQAVGPISIDMYLPAFPAIEHDFAAITGSAQFTLATWFVGIAAGQIMQGALSDRFGRRMPLLLGTLLYTIGCTGCALSGSIAQMAFWRFVAALGGSASMVTPRAVVRDCATGAEAARITSRLILILGAAPILAPSLGGVVLSFASWRWIFWITAAYGAIASALTALYLPDTLPAAKRVPLDPLALLARWRHIVTERTFFTHAMVLSFSAFSLFAYLSGTPVVFIQHYGLTPGRYAMVFGFIAACYILGAQLNIAISRRIGSSRALRLSSSVFLTAMILTLLMVVTGHDTVWRLGIALALAQSMCGFFNPAAIVGAMTKHAAHAGSASALIGTLQFMIGAISGFVIGPLMARLGGTATPMLLLMLLGAVSIKLADRARPEG